jgi:dTDP-4-dehydrorhamnose reductase
VKILVMGGEGMLGHKMFQTLASRFSDVACTIYGSLEDDIYSRIELFHGTSTFERVNAADVPALQQLLREVEPDVVVNCIGIVKQRPEAKDYIPSITLNSLLPHVLAGTLRPWGGRVIHFSTDCVFDGKRGGYSEDDPSSAEDLYGKSKYLGEVAAGNAVTFRTSIIGRELAHFKSLLEWLLSQNHKTVKGFTRALYSGVTTNHMAQFVGDVIEQHPQLSGLYHLVTRAVSKHDLLCMLRDAYGLDIEVIPDDSFFCDRSMQGDKLRQAIGYSCPPLDELVVRLAADQTPYARWRECPPADTC